MMTGLERHGGAGDAPETREAVAVLAMLTLRPADSTAAAILQQARTRFQDVLDVSGEMLAVFGHPLETLAAPFLPRGHGVRD